MAKKHEYEKGDWVLFRPSQGKIWKLCEIRDRDSIGGFFSSHREKYLSLKNLKSKNTYNSYLRASEQHGDIVIPVPKNTKVESMSMKALVTLYCPTGVDVTDNKMFKKSKSYNIQINSRNEKLMNKMVTQMKQAGFNMEEMDHRNSNISAKYLLKEE